MCPNLGNVQKSSCLIHPTRLFPKRGISGISWFSTPDWWADWYFLMCVWGPIDGRVLWVKCTPVAYVHLESFIWDTKIAENGGFGFQGAYGMYPCCLSHIIPIISNVIMML